MFKKAIEDLKLWKTSQDRKPIIIRGARQTGKNLPDERVRFISLR